MYLLNKLCESTIVNEETSDRHIEFVYKKVKEVKDNISQDKNRTVFAFLEGILKSKLVEASLKRLSIFVDKSDMEDEEVIELNIKFIGEIVHTYYVLLEMGIKKTTPKV